MIEQKADLNEQNFEGGTALNFAIMAGSHACVLALIKAGADINTREIYGKTPTQFAWDLKFYEIVKLLEKHGGRR